MFDRVRTEVKIRSKRIWLVLAALLTLGVATVVTWSVATRPAPQFVTLSDGVKYRFVGVTWGTNHINPGDSLAARVTDHLPGRWAAYVRAKFGARLSLPAPYVTSEPSLCVWLSPDGSNVPAGSVVVMYCMLADGQGVEAGEGSQVGYSTGQFPRQPAAFRIVPRRSRYLECHFLGITMVGLGNQPPANGSIRFANPLYGQHPVWQPEVLPATKRTGEVAVQLTNCFVGVRVSSLNPATGGFTNGYWPTARGVEATTEFGWLIEPARATDESWEIQSIELSDATGNHLGGETLEWAGLPGSWVEQPPPHRSYFANGMYFVDGTLWPDETAVRVRLALKRTFDRPTEDLVTFHNLPINRPNATNGTALTNLVQGVPIRMRNFPDQSSGSSATAGPGRYCFELELPGPQSGLVVDLVGITTDLGDELRYVNPREYGTFRSFNFSALPAGAKSVNVKLAVQKLRTVDFFVKPTKVER